MITNEALCREAIRMLDAAYAPYSGYKVGAALLDAEGTVWTGCNIENASFTPTVCAERTAFFKAISAGQKNFVRIAVAGGQDGRVEGVFPPCGVCRQVMSEFCRDSFEILMIRCAEPLEYETVTLDQLLPHRFTPDHLK